RSTTRLRSPWNGSIECPVHLERTQAVLVTLQLSPVVRREPMAGNSQQWSGRQVTQSHPCRRQLVDRVNPRIGDDLAAQRLEIADERVGYSLCAALGNHPAGNVRQRGEHQSESGGWTPVERQHRVSRHAGDQRTRRVVDEGPPHQLLRGAQRTETETSDGPRVTR